MVFERIREADKGSPVVTMVCDYGSCGLPAAGLTGRATNYKKILDHIPVGKYRPTTTIKVSEVQMATVKVKYSPLRLEWFDQYGQLTTRVKGYFFEKGQAIALNHSYLPDLIQDNPLRTQDLLKRAFAKVNEDSLGLGETFSELGAALKMLKNPLEGMQKIFKRVFHKRKGGRRNAVDAASAWLEYRYGWMPLYLTVCEILKEGIPNFHNNDILSFSAKDVERGEVVVPYLLRKFHPGTNPYAMGVVSYGKKITKTEYQARYYLRVTNAANYNAVKRGGSIYNIPAFLWEKATLSFAVDWWFDVGDSIKRLVPTQGVVIHPNVTVSTKQVETIRNDILGTGFVGKTIPVRYPAFTPWSESERVIYRRLVMPLQIQPILPNLDRGFNSIKHLVDALSLIIQQVPRKRK